MKSAKKLARVVLVVIITVITVAIAGTASARGMSLEVVEPAALEAGPDYRTPSLEVCQPLQVEILGRLPNIDMGIFPPGDASRTRSHEVAQPLQVEILGRAPATDFGFHPSDVAHRSGIRNVFPIQPEDAFFGRLPNIDMGIFPPGDASRTRSHELAQPLQVEILEKNPTEAVKQPPQCDNVCLRNPTEAVKRPPQCDNVCGRTPYEAVRAPLNLECFGPTMRFNMKEDANAEIAIYNVNGRLVRRLTARLSSGESTITWDGKDDRGGRAASGVYFAQVQANAQAGKGKLVVVR